MSEEQTITFTMTADTSKFDAATYRLWWRVWRIRIIQRPVVGRIKFAWAWLRRPRAWKRIGCKPS